ncbi:hypothetical protein J6590_105283 [Homalodisca vitripennis]|nr:hypothetical protein J6590_105283 [Homalodisca vitripennis]
MFHISDHHQTSDCWVMCYCTTGHAILEASHFYKSECVLQSYTLDHVSVYLIIIRRVTAGSCVCYCTTSGTGDMPSWKHPISTSRSVLQSYILDHVSVYLIIIRRVTAGSCACYCTTSGTGDMPSWKHPISTNRSAFCKVTHWTMFQYI